LNGNSGAIDSLFSDFISKIKNYLHQLNRSFFILDIRKFKVEPLSKILSEVNFFIQYNNDLNEDILEALNRISGQAYRMYNLLEKDYQKDQFTKEFLILRKFIERFEKKVVKFQYFIDTGIKATKVGGITWASKITKKSEVTIRRYIHNEKIQAYKVTKKWWIPYEELTTRLKRK